MTIDNAIKKIVSKEDLTVDEMKDVINLIVKGQVTSSQIGGFLIGLRVKGETSQELLGAVIALKENMVSVDVKYDNLIDTCGTGGDGGRTFNISTAVSIIAASSGVKVAKHGNRAVSSQSGSADVLKELGINTELNQKESKKLIEELGMSFLFAPNYHSAMKNVAKERKELATRTIFNLIGPLINPAPIRGQLMGIYDGGLLEIVGQVILDLGLDRALVVHGDDGLDEITTTTATNICEVRDGKLKLYKITPEEFNLSRASMEDIKGGTPRENSEIILDILQGVKGPRRDIVVFNSAAALYVGKRVESIREGIALANELIDSRKAYSKYLELANCSNKVS